LGSLIGSTSLDRTNSNNSLTGPGFSRLAEMLGDVVAGASGPALARVRAAARYRRRLTVHQTGWARVLSAQSHSYSLTGAD
jgi:hypothetical protein